MGGVNEVQAVRDMKIEELDKHLYRTIKGSNVMMLALKVLSC